MYAKAKAQSSIQRRLFGNDATDYAYFSSSELQPPLLYPQLHFNPKPLMSNEEQDYLVHSREHIKEQFQSLGFYVTPECKLQMIERYVATVIESMKTEPPWDNKLFPLELFDGDVIVETMKKSPNICSMPLKDIESCTKAEEVLGDENVKSDNEDDEDNASSKNEDEEDEICEDIETDYIANYFDNGENYMDNDDDHHEDDDGNFF